VQLSVPLHTAVDKLTVGGRYVFSLRCADVFGRWTPWSSSSEMVAICVPPLVPQQADYGGTGLRLTLVGSTSALVEWGQFRVGWGSAASQKSLDAALQRVAYRLRMARRPARSTGDWASVPICELVSERRLEGILTHEVHDLDERFDYTFHLAARWADVPPVLGVQDWSPEVSSDMLPTRLKTLAAVAAPYAEVLASDEGGICIQVRWRPCHQLRDCMGLPLAGSRYQLRFAQVPFDSDTGPEDPQEWEWREQLAVLENSTEPSGHEMVCKIRDAFVGRTYRFAIRVGDEHCWSGWSPASEPVRFAVPAPLPSQGDVLEVTCDSVANDSAQLCWRPFRTPPGLKRLEYKIMVVEWPFQESPDDDNGVLARVRRAADLSQGSLASRAIGQRMLRTVGYVGWCGHCGQLRPAGERIEWRTTGLRPGMYCRFFVCARYACLPMGAIAPLPECSPDAELETFLWPDEHCSQLRDDGLAWEASLSRVGLWSPIVNPALQQVGPPLAMPCAGPKCGPQPSPKPASAAAKEKLAESTRAECSIPSGGSLQSRVWT